MLHRVAAIALNTYREVVRARILLGLGGVALATALYSIAIGAFALRNARRVISDLGAASISLYAVAVAIVIGSTTLYREVEHKTLFPILARPVRRTEYLVGKYLGTVLVLAVFIAIDAAAVLLILSCHGGRGPWLPVGSVAAIVAMALVVGWRRPRTRTWLPLGVAVVAIALAAALASGVPDDRRVVLGAGVLTFCEVCIVAAIATLFASFSSPFVTAICTLGAFVVGREADTLGRLPARVFGATIKSIAAALAKVVPNLQVYVPPRPLLTGEAPGTSLGAYMALGLLQAAGWSVALLVLASLVFRRRDFT